MPSLTSKYDYDQQLVTARRGKVIEAPCHFLCHLHNCHIAIHQVKVGYSNTVIALIYASFHLLPSLDLLLSPLSL